MSHSSHNSTEIMRPTSLTLWSKRNVLVFILTVVAIWMMYATYLVKTADAHFVCTTNQGASQTTVAPELLTESLSSAVADIPGYYRPEETSPLSFPEYYIVYSAVEYAEFLKNNPPSQFPYFSAIAQYWQSYDCVSEYAAKRYPANPDSQLMLKVIGASFTIENAFKGMHERHAGRFTEWWSQGEQTTEDRYIQQTAEEYGRFLFSTPWYEFDFRSKFMDLCCQTNFFGPQLLRKWERKALFGIEYGGKALYGAGIKKATKSVYEPVELTIYLLVKNLPTQFTQDNKKVQVVKNIDKDHSVISMQRYVDFNELVPQLSSAGVEFLEIAGNQKIFITIVVDKDWQNSSPEVLTLFEMDVLTNQNQKRVGLVVPVPQLAETIRTFQNDKIQLERLYDY